MYEENRKSFSELVLPVRVAFSRYWGVAWAPALVVAGLIIAIGIKVPDYYVSDAIIYTESQKISSKVLERENKDDDSERLEAIALEILAGPRLRSVIEQFNPYPQYQGIMGKDKALRQFRNDMSTSTVQSPTGKVLASTFKLSYSHEDPRLAYEVTKALSNLFIEESIIAEKGRKEGTEEFLDSQLTAAKQRLEKMESQVQAFRAANSGKLPDQLQAALGRLDNANKQLASNSQLMTANSQRLSTLRQELSLLSKEPAAVVGGQTSPSDPQEALAQLEASLAVLLSRYSEEHPDVVNTRKRISALKAQVGRSGGGGGGGTAVGRGSSAEARTLRIEAGEIEAQMKAISEENTRLKKDIAELEANIKLMPAKQQELIKITRDYDNVKSNYERLLAAREDAGLQTSLVKSQKGSKFKLVEPPVLPVIPAGPNRLLFFAAGLICGILVLVAVPLGLFFMNSSFKFRDELESELGIPVIGVLPTMDTPRAAALARRASSTSVVASVLCLAAGAAIIVWAL